jgi:hypothetical protein
LWCVLFVLHTLTRPFHLSFFLSSLTDLVPKKFHGHCVTGKELLTFVKEYVKIFQEVEIFPEAKTLLAATCEANNRTAKDAAEKVYVVEESVCRLVVLCAVCCVLCAVLYCNVMVTFTGVFVLILLPLVRHPLFFLPFFLSSPGMWMGWMPSMGLVRATRRSLN